MTEDLKINIRPSKGPNKSPQEIAEFYKKFDGWQEILPKTDNTYSPGSKYYKYEVSPGIPLIPNMCRLPINKYEKTPLKNDWSEDQSNYFKSSSHIRRNLFSVKTYRNLVHTNHFKTFNHTETINHSKTETTTNQSTTIKITRLVSETIYTFVKSLFSYLFSLSMLTEMVKSAMELGSNITYTSIRKVTNWVHLATFSMVHYDLIIIMTIRRIVNRCFGHNQLNKFWIPIIISSLILGFIAGVMHFYSPMEIQLWDDSWTHFLLSPFNTLFNIIKSVCLTLSSTAYFVFEIFTLGFASSMVAFRLFGQMFINVFNNVNSVVSSATKANTASVNHYQGALPFDYNILAKKILESEEFQHLIIKQLNITKIDLVRLYDQEFHQTIKNQLQEMNSENLKWINDQLNSQKLALKSVYHKISKQDQSAVDSIEKKMSDLQNTVSDLIKNFEKYKAESEYSKSKIETAPNATCTREDWYSITNYIEKYVNMTMKTTLNIYDADKTGKVDYALESAGATVLGTRCTITKSSTAALTMFGIPLWYISNGPRLAIQPGVYPGQCWAFVGAKGFLVLKLSNTIFVRGFTIEHLPRSLSEDGNIRSAPKDFSVWGLEWETDSNGTLLGKNQFQVDGPSLQYFEAMKSDDSFSIVELRIESNHGHDEYTCLYRIRIHGIPA